jgi:hypothetical protein
VFDSEIKALQQDYEEKRGKKSKKSLKKDARELSASIIKLKKKKG